MKTPSKKRAFFCTIVPPILRDGGTIVCREHLKNISNEGYEIHLATELAEGETEGREFVASIGATLHHLQIYSAPGAKSRSPENWSSFLFERMARNRPELDRDLLKLVEELQPNVIVFEYLFSALFFPSAFFTGIPVVTITQNDETVYYRGLRKMAWHWDAANSRAAEWRLSRYERDVYRTSNGVVFLTPNDIPNFLKNKKKASVIEPLFELEEAQWRYQENSSLFFVGNQAHFPNYLAIQWLCETFAPLLMIENPDARIVIIGAAENSVPESWCSPNVEFLGDSTKEEVVRRFVTSSLFIAPIRSHFGAKIKTVQCFSHGTPMVATDAALSGFGASSEIPRISLDQPYEAVRLVNSFLKSKDELVSLSFRQQNSYSAVRTAQEGAWTRVFDGLPESLGEPLSFTDRLLNIAAKRRLQKRIPKPSPMAPFFPLSFRGVEIGVRNAIGFSYENVYPPEDWQGESLRWTMPDAILTGRLDPKRKPTRLSTKLWNIAPATGTQFRIFVNEIEVIEGKLGEEGFDREVDLPDLSDYKDLRIRIQSDGFEVQGDVRQLGVAIKSLRIS